MFVNKLILSVMKIDSKDSYNQFSSLFENLICVDRKSLFTNINC